MCGDLHFLQPNILRECTLAATSSGERPASAETAATAIKPQRLEWNLCQTNKKGQVAWRLQRNALPASMNWSRTSRSSHDILGICYGQSCRRCVSVPMQETTARARIMTELFMAPRNLQTRYHISRCRWVPQSTSKTHARMCAEVRVLSRRQSEGTRCSLYLHVNVQS